MTFDPHPAEIVRPGTPGAPSRVAGPPSSTAAGGGGGRRDRGRGDTERLELEPVAFLEWLVATHAPTVVVEGPDFRFGRDRAGDVETLRAHGARLGFRAELVAPLDLPLANQHLVRASSSIVRWLVARGRMMDAAAVLGRPYALDGRVVRGDQRGRTLGIPTANLEHEQLLPADGIYAGRAWLPDGTSRVAAISVGTKPTFGASPRVAEAHLLDFDGAVDDYGWSMHLEVHAWLRAQIRYDDLDGLLAQLDRDLAAVRARMADAAPDGAVPGTVSP